MKKQLFSLLLTLISIIVFAQNEKPKEEKKGVSIFGIALGVVLLVGTAGAYNYFSKNK